MEIKNVKIYDLEECLKASGYPMSTNPDSCTVSYDRGAKLGNTPTGSGHSTYLSGIRVSFDLTYSQYFSMQLQRYNFLDIVSSQSKMHRLTSMDIKEQCNKYVTDLTINMLEKLISEYNEAPTPDKYMSVISNCPMGLELTMRVSTNYQQLKTIYNQRKNHKLTDWGIFCDWIKTLDYFQLLCLNDKSQGGI